MFVRRLLESGFRSSPTLATGTRRSRDSRSGSPSIAAAVVAVAIVVTCVSSLALAAPTRHGSIVYLDANRNVWITSPDGTAKRQITTDGLTNRYTSPSETDAGVIVAPGKNAMFHYFRVDGKPAGGPWTAGDMDCASEQNAGTNQVNPAGTMNVYSYLSVGCLEYAQDWVAFANYGNLTAKGIHARYVGGDPRWVPGTHYAAAVDVLGNNIFTTNSAEGTPWIASPGLTDYVLRYFDISRSGGKVLIAEASKPKDLHSRSILLLWQNHGTPPAGGSQVCTVSNWGDNGLYPDISKPRWSPDGTEFTWSDRRGVWVSPAPVRSGGGHCTIHPKLIVPGGISPDWGLPDVAAS